MNKLMARARAFWASLKVFWASLPHQVQAGVVIFVTVAGTTLSKELQALIFGTGSFTLLSLKHDIAAASVAGFLAARAFYMLPNREPVASGQLPVASENKS